MILLIATHRKRFDFFENFEHFNDFRHSGTKLCALTRLYIKNHFTNSVLISPLGLKFRMCTSFRNFISV